MKPNDLKEAAICVYRACMDKWGPLNGATIDANLLVDYFESPTKVVTDENKGGEMKQFNLEAAKRGEPICTADGRLTYFVGVRRDGAVVTETNNNNNIHVCAADELCMAPKKRTIWVNVYPNAHAIYHRTELEANDYGVQTQRIGGKAYPVEIDE